MTILRVGLSVECGKWFVCIGWWTDGSTHPGTWGTIGSQMITSELAVFCIVVTRKCLLEKMLCMKNSLPWKAPPFTVGSVARCAHCTLGCPVLCDRVAPWELVCRSSCCSSCSWDVSSSDGVSWRSFVYARLAIQVEECLIYGRWSLAG